MNPIDALKVLDLATTPQNIVRLSRADFTNVESAILCLKAFIESNPPKDPAAPAS